MGGEPTCVVDLATGYDETHGERIYLPPGGCDLNLGIGSQPWSLVEVTVDVLLLVGRLLFGLIFLASAVGHLTQTEAMAGYAGSKGVPVPKVATLVSGVVILVGALLVILGLWGDLGALLLVLFLVPTAFLMHAFWKESGAMERQTEQIQFFKDLALAGGALVLLWLFTQVDVPFALGSPLFGG